MADRSGYDSGGETPGENTDDVQRVRDFLKSQSGKKPEESEPSKNDTSDDD